MPATMRAASARTAKNTNTTIIRDPSRNLGRIASDNILPSASRSRASLRLSSAEVQEIVGDCSPRSGYGPGPRRGVVRRRSPRFIYRDSDPQQHAIVLRLEAIRAAVQLEVVDGHPAVTHRAVD